MTVYEDEKFLAQQQEGIIRICGEVLSKQRIAELAKQRQQQQQYVQKPANLIIGMAVQKDCDFMWAANMWHNVIPKSLPPNTGFIYENKYGIAYTRESIVNQFLGVANATHLLFLDSDIQPMDITGINTLIQDTMLAKENYIVSGCYYNSLYTGLAAWKNEKPLNFKDPNDIINTSNNPIIEVDKTGMGYCMIRRDLFDILDLEDEDRPLFYYKIKNRNADMQSEDFHFQKKLEIKYNIKPRIDNRVKAQHIKRAMLNPDGTVSF